MNNKPPHPSVRLVLGGVLSLLVLYFLPAVGRDLRWLIGLAGAAAGSLCYWSRSWCAALLGRRRLLAPYSFLRFYKQLFEPIEERIGQVDEGSITAFIGFDCGGPVTLCTVGRGRKQFVTFVTCELSVREEQHPAEFGRYEVMMTCDDEKWAHKTLTKIGQMSLESAFGHGHTIDISPVVGADCPVQGLVVEEFARVTVDRQAYCITRSELKFAIEAGADELLERLKRAGIYPRTSVQRRDSVEITA